MSGLILYKEYLKAYQGFRFWRKIQRDIPATHYVLMPDEDSKYNYFALLHMKSYLTKKGFAKTVLLSCDKKAVAASKLFVEEEKLFPIYLKRRCAKQLIKYYSLNQFTSKITIISFREPYDTCAENLLGHGGVTEEQLVCYDIFGFEEVPEQNKPIYEGEDSCIISFLCRNKES